MLQSYICGIHGHKQFYAWWKHMPNIISFISPAYPATLSPLPVKGEVRIRLPVPIQVLSLDMNMQYVHACTLFFCIFSEQKRGAQRMSGCLLVLFFWLSPEQPHELLACTIQTLLSKQLLFSSWALLYCSLLQYLNASQILRYLFLHHSPGHAITPLYWS